jgi:outer membrane murein-binding lipoprotein Lpp
MRTGVPQNVLKESTSSSGGYLVPDSFEERIITKLEEEKTGLENQVTKIKAQVEELNTEITSLKDEVTTAKDEVELKKEELAKANKLIEQLKKLLQESIATQGASSAKGTAVKSLPVGDKGRIIIVDNVNMFAIVSFSAEAMKELKGPNLNQPLPILELGVKRPGHKGDAGEFVGRLRIRQEVKGKPYVICDILGAWEQSKLLPDDVVFAD